ncbi:MAG: ABC transporter ATP-binding protein [Chloroflexi bacterium]|nr:ABC transporter ATP-binding protein [Chloroflexota bacterium]
MDGVIPHALDAHWDGGSLVVAGRETRSASLADLTRQVAVLFQDPETQLAMLEVDDEVAFGLENHGVDRAEMRRRVASAKARLGLEGERVPRRLDQLSGGMKQRVTLASLLALEPRGLVLDEPTANLDGDGARAVLDAIAELARDRSRSLLLIEHRLDDVLALIDRVAVLGDDGSLALGGTAEEVFVAGQDRLDELGVWIPQLRLLARALGSDALPRSPAEAARIVVERWPAHRSVPPADPSPGAPAIVARGVSYRYGRGAPWAVDGVGLAVASGEFVALVGANGSGKSTLGLLLAGALRAARGTIDSTARVGYVFQYPEHQLVTTTVAGEFRVTGAPEERVAALLARIGLAALAEANPFTLSHGQKRRLSVATALAIDPDVLILDEPTFGQDRRHSEELLAMLEELHREGRAVVVITHDLPLVADHAERVIELRDGRVVFDGPAQRYFEPAERGRPPVAEAFRIARLERADVPPLLGLRAVQRALGR